MANAQEEASGAEAPVQQRNQATEAASEEAAAEEISQNGVETGHEKEDEQDEAEASPEDQENPDNHDEGADEEQGESVHDQSEGLSDSGRRRKKVSRFGSNDEVAPKERSVPAGKGIPLGEMPNVMANLKEVTFTNPHLRMLHILCLGVGKRREFKDNLAKFCGVVFQPGKEEDGRDALRAKVSKLISRDLHIVMDLADVERGAQSFGRSPTKDMLVDRLVEWLEDPKPSGNSRKRRPLKGARQKGKKKVATTKKSTTKSSSKDLQSSSSKKRQSPASSTTGKRKKGKTSATSETAISIPGTTVAQLRARVASIVEKGDTSTITVKEVRTALEDWLDADLSSHKDAIRELVMEALQE